MSNHFYTSPIRSNGYRYILHVIKLLCWIKDIKKNWCSKGLYFAMKYSYFGVILKIETIHTHTHTHISTGCPTRYRTRHFFNNYNTNEDIATKFEQEYVRCVRNVTKS